MADTDDELTQRERRARRHSQTKRKDAPADFARAVRTYGPLTLIIVAVLAAGTGVYYLSNNGPNCPDHWHATVNIYLPGMKLVDFAAPRTTGGLHYYDYDSSRQGGDASFSGTLHMHQSSTSQETGSSAQGPAQWHMEGQGKCITVARGLHVVEVDADSDSLTLFGGHSQVPGQSGTFTANATSPLTYYVQSLDTSTCTFKWSQWSWSKVSGHQLQDGESLLVALGSYTPDQVSAMQSQVPTTNSRDGLTKACNLDHASSHSSSSATGTSTMNMATTTTSAPTGTARSQPGQN